ncbi:MAG: RagB/SusD family nutrient uptake outer membrane protein [Bacteroidetes bacterium]|nr:RagB/SusD family nutrient uptake outer membrane protein [Bacteroidota bacterium]
MKKFIITLFILSAIIVGCNKDFLNKIPLNQLTTETAFVTYANFQTYTWSLYDYLAGFGNSGATMPPAFNSQENSNSDNISNGTQSSYINQSKLPTTSAGNPTSSLQISTWDFSYVRKVDIMLDNIDKSSMGQADKDHWRSVGYFFRALRYYDLIAAFGDVPWIEHSLSDTSAGILYGNRTARDTVAMNMLNNLIWAESHIKATGDGANTINVNVVRALLSRFGLFEGTWRKNHNLSNANTYLTACATYSQKLLTSFPSVMSSYDDVNNSEDLSGKAGIILFKQYITTIYNNPMLTRYTASTSWNCDVPKSAVESFLCTDGRPISTSTVYQGDDSMYASFKNRDRRLYFTVTPPYSVKFINKSITAQASNSDNLWAFDAIPQHGAFVRLMNDSIPGNINKRLPFLAQTQDMKSGNVIPNIPHFTSYTAALSNLPTDAIAISQAVSKLGYFYWKYYNRLPMDGASNYGGTQDCPLFRIEEVMLNYAEAQFELGAFNQSIADVTINKLRPRANVANMVVSAIDANFDLKRDPTVDPVLWEIRRERRIELFGDGFRFNDIKRWKKGAYLNDYQLGVKINKANYPIYTAFNITNVNILIDGGTAVGYVKNSPVPLGWLDKYYLEPVPLQEIAINPRLSQNPGW